MPRLTRAPRTVVGYHGCTAAVAERILDGGRFLPSENAYDWLGRGTYFWEYAPFRALEWARFVASRTGRDRPVVLRANIRLGTCLNLLDTEHIGGLRESYRLVADTLDDLPVNTSRGAHYLDRLVIDTYCEYRELRTTYRIHTVRGCFPEGEPIYLGSRILSKAHVQIAVRDPDCISNIRLVAF